MLTREEAKKITDRVLAFTTFQECSVSLLNRETVSIRYALNSVTTSGFQVAQALSISVTKDNKTGSISLSEFDDKSLSDAVKRAEELSGITPPNPEFVPGLGPQTYSTFDNFVEGTAAARNKEMIPAVRAVIEGARAKNLIAAGFFERDATVAVIADKRGLFGFERSTDSRLSTTVRTPDGSSSGWASRQSPDISQVISGAGSAVAAAAIGKCDRWRNPKRLDPGNYTVVLEPTAVSDLVQLIGFNARAAEEGRSFLSKKGGGTLLGEKLFPEFITLRTDPFDKRNRSLVVDNSGMPAAPVTWIEKGVVKNLQYDRYWAMQTGKQPTPYANRMVLDGGTESLESMIAGVERGLLVTRFWYLRNVNPQTLQYTGLTRDGLFLIENGKVTSPVGNFRFNESPVRLLQNILKMGVPERAQGGEGSGMIAPALVVKDFPFTSVSDAV
jgi:predicted Zn-dependent protease